MMVNSDAESNENSQDPRPQDRSLQSRAANSEQSAGPKKFRPALNPPPDAAACLSGLGQLPGMLTLGIISTAQANSLKGIYSTILQHHRANNSNTETRFSDPDVMDMLRKDPHVLNMLAPLLTEEQLAAVMQQLKDEENGQA